MPIGSDDWERLRLLLLLWQKFGPPNQFHHWLTDTDKKKHKDVWFYGFNNEKSKICIVMTSASKVSSSQGM